MAKAQQKGAKYIGRFSLLIILFTGGGNDYLSNAPPIITPEREISSQKYANPCRWYVFVLMERCSVSLYR